jgi:hypothetical protein
LETDDERILEEFWKAGEFSPSIGEEGDSAASPGERERWLRVTVPAADCTKLWPHPSSFLTQKQMPMSVVRSFETDRFYLEARMGRIC